MAMIFLFLRVKSKKTPLSEKISRIDYIGNFLLIASTVSILYPLTYGGTILQWSSWRAIFPLVIGLLGLGVFMFYETLKMVKEPLVPPNLFSNRTSSTVFAVTFMNAALLYWILFFLPVYFQAVRGSSPARSGVLLLPAIVVGVPGAAVAVLLLAKYGRYKPLHLLGFGIFTLGVGLFVLFDRETPLAQVVVFEMIAAGGSGFVLNTLLPACQAPLEEKDQAAITAAWSFMRSFGSIWGVAIPSAIFNNRFSQLLGRIQDPQVAAMFTNGAAYQHATAAFLNSFSEPTKDQLIGVYTDSLKRVWEIAIVFSGVAFLLVFIEKEIKLRTELDTDFGLETENTADVETVEKKTSEVDQANRLDDPEY